MHDTMEDDRNILIKLGSADAPLLGEGGEARVYALDEQLVIRIMRAGAQLSLAQDRQVLMREISEGAQTLPFRTPLVEKVEAIDNRVVLVERRLPGTAMSTLLQSTEGSARRQLIASYLDTSQRVGDIAIARNWYGPLLGVARFRKDNFADFLRLRLVEVASTCPDDLREKVLLVSEEQWDEPERARLVHLDYFPANVLAEGDAVSAVIDFGPSAIMGDPRFDAWAAVAYLDPEISPHATDEDRRQAMEWLAENGLAQGYAQAKRWLAASWTHASDDVALMAWCRRVLLA